MKKVTIAFTITLFLIVYSLSVKAQTPETPNALGFKVLFLDYYTPNSSESTSLDNISTGYELSYLRSINKNLDLVIPLRLGVIDLFNSTDNISMVGLDAIFKFKLYREGSIVSPYLFAGGGYVFEDMQEGHFQAPAGIGANFNIWRKAFLNVQGAYRYSPIEERNALELGLGFIVNLGGGAGKDSDKDGIPDERDKCPKEAGSQLAMGCPDKDNDGVPDNVDKCPDMPGAVNGCPDSDEDGIADIEDECPEEAGIPELNGCPKQEEEKATPETPTSPDTQDVTNSNNNAVDNSGDSDGDGVPNAQDECPQQAGSVAAKGCPDKDNDGVPDKDDQCPNYGSRTPSGCPDKDGDGVPDEKDRCPNISGPIASNGCPDSDNDGIPDPSDKCPTEFGPSSNMGCPELASADKNVLATATNSIHFENNKSLLKPSSFEVLDQVASILLKYPNYSINIEGHTDIIGGTRHNQKLSEERARACYSYLLSKGVSESRMSYVGYGVTRPIADNKTKEGREINRRVEFKLYLR